jgi:hypothetical membrane protein
MCNPALCLYGKFSRSLGIKIMMELTRNYNKVLLICGIIAPLLYIITDLIASLLYERYSYTDQAISELSAIGAPTQSLWTTMLFLFEFLIIAFGIGVWFSADHKRTLRITGILLTLWGIFGFSWLFFPMNMRGNTGSFSDVGHLVLSALTPVIISAFIGFGSGAMGKGFRIYSIMTIVVMLVFGAWTGMLVPRVAAQLPTPGMGLIERTAVFSPMIWILVLAIILLNTKNKEDIDLKRTR